MDEDLMNNAFCSEDKSPAGYDSRLFSTNLSSCNHKRKQIEVPDSSDILETHSILPILIREKSDSPAGDDSVPNYHLYTDISSEQKHEPMDVDESDSSDEQETDRGLADLFRLKNVSLAGDNRVPNYDISSARKHKQIEEDTPDSSIGHDLNKTLPEFSREKKQEHEPMDVDESDSSFGQKIRLSLSSAIRFKNPPDGKNSGAMHSEPNEPFIAQETNADISTESLNGCTQGTSTDQACNERNTTPHPVGKAAGAMFPYRLILFKLFYAWILLAKKPLKEHPLIRKWTHLPYQLQRTLENCFPNRKNRSMPKKQERVRPPIKKWAHLAYQLQRTLVNCDPSRKKCSLPREQERIKHLKEWTHLPHLLQRTQGNYFRNEKNRSLPKKQERVRRPIKQLKKLTHLRHLLKRILVNYFPNQKNRSLPREKKLAKYTPIPLIGLLIPLPISLKRKCSQLLLQKKRPLDSQRITAKITELSVNPNEVLGKIA